MGWNHKLEIFTMKMCCKNDNNMEIFTGQGKGSGRELPIRIWQH